MNSTVVITLFHSPLGVNYVKKVEIIVLAGLPAILRYFLL